MTVHQSVGNIPYKSREQNTSINRMINRKHQAIRPAE